MADSKQPKNATDPGRDMLIAVIEQLHIMRQQVVTIGNSARMHALAVQCLQLHTPESGLRRSFAAMVETENWNVRRAEYLACMIDQMIGELQSAAGLSTPEGKISHHVH